MGLRGAAAAAAVAAGTAVIKTVVSGTPSGWGPSAHEDPTRWRVVTVNRPISELEALPAPLADLGDAVEVRLVPAPADRGTEIHARLTGSGHDRIHGQQPLEALRSALREAKQVAEVGYVLEADLNTTAKRTPLNEPLRQATRHAGGEGRL